MVDYYSVMQCKSPKTSQLPQKPCQGDQLIHRAIPNQARNSQTSCFVSVPRSSQGDSMGLWLQLVVMV